MSNIEENRKLLELLTCPICLERFQSPRTLPCLHSFCTECLDRCRRPHRHSIDCPVCKRNVPLPSVGVKALQVDHRIQQIEDILKYHQQRPNAVENVEICNDKCQLCKVQKRQPLPDGSKRCSQCNMVFCVECTLKHDANPVFLTHRMHDLSDLVDICSRHVGCVFKYYCKQCQTLLCTICVLEHNTDHEQEPWDRATMEKYKEQLTEMFHQVSIKVRELKGKTKRLEILRQNHKGSLYMVQALIKSTSDELVQKIRKRECQLLEESQMRIDGFLRELGIDAIGDLNFKQTQIVDLHSELESLLNDSSLCKCFVVYDSLVTKCRCLLLEPLPKSNMHGVTNQSVRSKILKKNIKFVPSSAEDVNFIIGTLQEFSVISENESLGAEQKPRAEAISSMDGVDSELPSSSNFNQLSTDLSDVNYKPHRKRTKLILDALSLRLDAMSSPRIDRRIKSPCRTLNRNHLIDNIESSARQDVGPAVSASDINFTEIDINSDNLNVENDVSVFGSIQNLTSCVSSSVYHNDALLSSDVYNVQPIMSTCYYSPLLTLATVHNSVEASLIPLQARQGDEGTSSSNVSFPLNGNSLSSKYIRQFLHIERIGSLLGNLLPSKSIAFVKGSDACPSTGPFSGGPFADLFRQPCPASDWLLVVAETSHRLHVFDSKGSSNRLIGWGNIKPQVVVYSEGGLVYCTDKKDMTVKTFHLSKSWFMTSWQVGMFEHPHGLAVTTKGHLVITDVGRNTVAMHCSVTGRILQRLVLPKDNFDKPAYVAVDKEDNVYVSDVSKKCIFVFNKSGNYIRTITLPPEQLNSSTSSLPPSLSSSIPPLLQNVQAIPHGIAIDPNGHLAVCDWENNRIVSCTPDGGSFSVYHQCRDLFHPVNISFDKTGKYFAVVESLDSSDNGRVKVYEVVEYPTVGR